MVHKVVLVARLVVVHAVRLGRRRARLDGASEADQPWVKLCVGGVAGRKWGRRQRQVRLASRLWAERDAQPTAHPCGRMHETVRQQWMRRDKILTRYCAWAWGRARHDRC